MKPFNMSEALAGKPLVTRDGTEVIAFHYAEGAETIYSCVAFLRNRGWTAYTDCGRRYDNSETVQDLFMAPAKRTVYVNIFQNGHADWFSNEKEARAGLNARALKIAVPVTFEV
jgi:hypothetical protein